jgi:hypothetical protein
MVQENLLPNPLSSSRGFIFKEKTEIGVGHFIARIIGRALLWLLAAAAVVWVGDWLVWQGRSLGGQGYGAVTVDRFVVAPLKGNKEQYYPDGRTEVRCTRSLLPEGLPQAGAKPCWWVERNPVVFDR